MTSRDRLHGLYVITDPVQCARHGIDTGVALALEGGARLVQYRDKSPDSTRRLAEAGRLRALCERHDALFVVNDDIELAKAAGAHGIHLGRNDAGIAAARNALGDAAIIGISCYDDFERARQAASQGADYVAFGSVFPSSVKPDAVRAPLALFDRARHELDVPACAIGGIDHDNISRIVAAGASMAAVISAVFDSDDIRAAARRLVDAFEPAG